MQIARFISIFFVIQFIHTEGLRGTHGACFPIFFYENFTRSQNLTYAIVLTLLGIITCEKSTEDFR
jgi:hypothetical protein